jgi:hypothetical protein
MEFHDKDHSEVIMCIDEHVKELQNHQLINENNLLKFIYLDFKKRRQPYFDRWCQLSSRQLFLTAMLRRRVDSYVRHIRAEGQTTDTKSREDTEIES